MVMVGFERLFPEDVFTKRQRVERTLANQPVDRVALHDQLSWNPGVVAAYCGRTLSGFNYTAADVGAAIRQTLDACFLPVTPLGEGWRTDSDGFTYFDDDWNSSLVGRPFNDAAGARAYLRSRTSSMRSFTFNPGAERARYHAYMTGLQALVGETVVIDFSFGTGFCDCWSKLGLEIFSYLYAEDPQVIQDYIAACTCLSVRAVEAAADPALSPVVLIAEDFASTTGSIFSPALLQQLHFPYLRQLTDAWHARGLKVLYHSDGNWKRLIPELAACGVDGFYCLEPALGMDLVALRQAWPSHTWAGGVDGVDLMERGTPEKVRAEVRRQILQADALARGGVFIGSSSEINPPVRVENFKAMVASVGELRNSAFYHQEGRPTPSP
jgi:hypothetical protein